ncbi:MAG TPA: DMT family transporter [Bacteroidales bacterium]|nr:DMT family transporter [Bacteroidales bacterium]HQH18087.1 DMT family transporter [Bacteroidales bacterium]HQI44590.1 DMT family transporter [Bacteroidales bacterium]
MKNYKAHIALLVANIFFGINFPIAKSLMPEFLQPIEIIILRASISTILFWIVSYFLKKDAIQRKDYFMLALCGLFGVSINQLLFFEGLNLSNPVDASIIMATIPVMVFIFSVIGKLEKLNISKTIGILLGAFGAIITILFGKEVNSGTNPILGNLFLFINALSYSIYFIIVKPLLEKYQAFTVMKWTFLFGFLFILPFIGSAFTKVNWESFNEYTWMSLAYVIVATTFLAYLLIAYSMKFVKSSVASYYKYFQPIVAGLLAVWMFNEKITIIKIISTLMIFTGVYLIGFRTRIKKDGVKE